MEIWQAVILGFIQGLTEFLPVSSSGHIALFQGIFRINDDDIALFFSIVLHLGTLVAVCSVFWREILELFKKPFKKLGLLVLATVPAGVVGILYEIFDIDVIFRGQFMGIFLAVFFLFTACLLFTTERVAKSRTSAELPLCIKTAVPMGAAQALAVLPGISRSGSTICAGTLVGCNREDVAKFSFIMSIPVILGSFAVELFKGLYSGELQASFEVGGATLGWSIALGFIISALSGLFAIKVMLKVIKKANYKWFSLYLVLLAIACFVLHFTYFGI